MHVALFDTPIGWCGVTWGEHGIVGVQLPERSERATLARLRRRFPQVSEAAPPGHVQHAINAIIAVLSGERRDLSAIELDMSGIPDFQQRVYAVARTIPPGSTLSYGEIAERVGGRTMARDVGQAMGQNPFPIIVPCHRVLAAGGKVGGFSAAGGITTKLKLLNIEGAQVGDAPTLFQTLPLQTGARRR